MNKDEGTPPGDEEETSGGTSDESVPRERRGFNPPGAHDASGFVLSLLLWSWVGLPFVLHGATGVKDVLRAKFLNKGPSGNELP